MKPKFKIITLSVLFLLSMSFSIGAQENVPGETGKRRNPFIPQLPVEAELEPPKPEPAPSPQPRPRPQPAPEPVKPQVKQPTRMPTFNITGIVWNSDRPQAIINGSVKDIGDSIDGVEIISIHKEGIDVSFQGKNMTIKVN
ncbi:MAG: hypothetical protein KC684_10275 [Candidatus Omnitrophica bacterium]|nr:hypothetical protein [Candidatus Omnitrophota bacterium]